MHRPVQPFDEVPSFPGSCILRLGQQRVFGSPRPRVPSAAPATNLRVAPHLRSIWLCRRWIFESPRISHPSAVPVSLKSRVAPILQLLLQHLRCRPQVAPRPASPALPAMGSSGCPESLIFGGADCPISGFPLRSVLRYRRRSVFQIPPCRVARIANLPAPAGGRPSFLGVAPSVFAIVESSGRPESSSLAR
jgi:hypothetical protein